MEDVSVDNLIEPSLTNHDDDGGDTPRDLRESANNTNNKRPRAEDTPTMEDEEKRWRLLSELSTALRQSRPPVQQIVRIVSEYGGNGDILWHLFPAPYYFSNAPPPMFIERIFNMRDEKDMIKVLRELVAINPDIRLNTNKKNGQTSFFALAVEKQLSLQAMEALAHPSLAIVKNLHHGETPLFVACTRRRLIDTAKAHFLINLNPEALRVKNSQGNLPLHSACYCDLSPGVLTMLIDAYPEALGVSNDCHHTPIMILVKKKTAEELQQPGVFPLLCQILRQAPNSIRTSLPFHPGRDHKSFRTALFSACESCPHLELVSLLIEIWPLALIASVQEMGFPFTRRLPYEALEVNHDFEEVPQEVVDLVNGETIEVFLALVEVLLHDKVHVVPSSIQDFVREQFQTHFPVVDVRAGSFAIAQSLRALLERPVGFCAAILHHLPLQDLLVENDQLMGELICGLYRMNKAGRSSTNLRATSGRHGDIMEAAKDNIDCLFLHLRDSPNLFTNASA